MDFIRARALRNRPISSARDLLAMSIVLARPGFPHAQLVFRRGGGAVNFGHADAERWLLIGRCRGLNKKLY